MRGYASSLRNVVTSTGARPSMSGPVRFQIPSPGSGVAKTGLIRGGQAFGLAEPTPRAGSAFSCGPPFFGAFHV